MLNKLKNLFQKDQQTTEKRPFNTIGYFQFDNLVQNRVPFVLYNMSHDLKEHYKSIYLAHLERHQQLITKEMVMADLKEKNHAPTTAIILICADGKASTELYFELETAGYTNVYVINGGYQQMMTEKAQG